MIPLQAIAGSNILFFILDVISFIFQPYFVTWVSFSLANPSEVSSIADSFDIPPIQAPYEYFNFNDSKLIEEDVKRAWEAANRAKIEASKMRSSINPVEIFSSYVLAREYIVQAAISSKEALDKMIVLLGQDLSYYEYLGAQNYSGKAHEGYIRTLLYLESILQGKNGSKRCVPGSFEQGACLVLFSSNPASFFNLILGANSNSMLKQIKPIHTSNLEYFASMFEEKQKLSQQLDLNIRSSVQILTRLENEKIESVDSFVLRNIPYNSNSFRFGFPGAPSEKYSFLKNRIEYIQEQKKFAEYIFSSKRPGFLGETISIYSESLEESEKVLNESKELLIFLTNLAENAKRECLKKSEGKTKDDPYVIQALLYVKKADSSDTLGEKISYYSKALEFLDASDKIKAEDKKSYFEKIHYLERAVKNLENFDFDVSYEKDILEKLKGAQTIEEISANWATLLELETKISEKFKPISEFLAKMQRKASSAISTLKSLGKLNESLELEFISYSTRDNLIYGAEKRKFFQSLILYLESNMQDFEKLISDFSEIEIPPGIFSCGQRINTTLVLVIRNPTNFILENITVRKKVDYKIYSLEGISYSPPFLIYTTSLTPFSEKRISFKSDLIPVQCGPEVLQILRDTGEYREFYFEQNVSMPKGACVFKNFSNFIPISPYKDCFLTENIRAILREKSQLFIEDEKIDEGGSSKYVVRITNLGDALNDTFISFTPKCFILSWPQNCTFGEKLYCYLGSMQSRETKVLTFSCNSSYLPVYEQPKYQVIVQNFSSPNGLSENMFELSFSPGTLNESNIQSFKESFAQEKIEPSSLFEIQELFNKLEEKIAIFKTAIEPADLNIPFSPLYTTKDLENILGKYERLKDLSMKQLTETQLKNLENESKKLLNQVQKYIDELNLSAVSKIQSAKKNCEKACNYEYLEKAAQEYSENRFTAAAMYALATRQKDQEFPYEIVGVFILLCFLGFLLLKSPHKEKTFFKNLG
ncbi:MAG: hypothetical protein QW097_00490 [archaeon]